MVLFKRTFSKYSATSFLFRKKAKPVDKWAQSENVGYDTIKVVKAFADKYTIL